MMQASSKDENLILLGLGANLPSRHGTPRQSLEAAMLRLEELGIHIIKRSRFWLTAPVPVSDDPWYVNAVCAVECDLEPESLLAKLHQVEEEFGRVRTVVNAPRVLDLDLLVHGDQQRGIPNGLTLPHPRLGERAFVLLPIRDIAPNWRHPVTNEALETMIARIPADQHARPEDQQ